MDTAMALPWLLLMNLPITCWGHITLMEPPARNAISGDRNSYCPSCGNGPDVCGDGGQWPADSDYLNFYDGPQRVFTAGQLVKFEVAVIAHHRGHYEISVCDQPINSSLTDAQACLDRHVLQRAQPEEVFSDCQVDDARGDCQPYLASQAERWYLPGASKGMHHVMHFRLPADLTCTRCTVQFKYYTANSCIPKDGYGCYFNNMESLGWNKVDFCGFYCGACPGDGQPDWIPKPDPGCGEEFRNCADIQILPSGSTTPTTTTSTPVASTTPEQASTASTTAGGDASCSPTSYGATAESCMKCVLESYKVWPCNDDRACACTRNTTTSLIGGNAGSSTSTTAAETTETTTVTTTAATCRAAKGSDLVAATDERCKEACSRVPKGIWPCSDDGPCNCDESYNPPNAMTSSAATNSRLATAAALLLLTPLAVQHLG
eukprot:gb/GFBE01079022.1/.p1 GENE.gb/GFBE01079022.1/~~gb/GFBE01079022.1/.p1  ORF type:complete len:433 (+),score=58.75 gb/GFBE01079022.1/:1-1299(+)